MRYLGSKTLLLNNIKQIAMEYKEQGCFCDPFGGIGTVGSFMKSLGYSVITGDILNFAHYFQISLIQNNKLPDFNNLMNLTNTKSHEELEAYLSRITKDEGWFIKEYSVERGYFTENNAKHIQACIDSIWKWKDEGVIDENSYAVLIASLIQSLDKVANTAGTYYAYLKEYYRKSKKAFKFRFLMPTIGQSDGKSVLMNANDLVKKCKCDILYLDPPYNERNYGRYYHLPETIAVGKIPIPKGKSGVYVSESKPSQYNNKREATVAFENLVHNSTAGCIIFHYTDNGLINTADTRDILNQLGEVEEFYFDSRGYNTTSHANQCQHHIFRVIR
ncbi:MAG TPA: hypothetical protein GXX75_08365 [Clostridiales bacterium]|nr:hypothetical protein [Clostridiales bacterium]